MTPRELAYAIVAVRGHVASPLARDELADLMRRFPDTAQDGKQHGGR
jgi:uncharacterized phage protein (TIGR02216 family)